MIVEGRARVFGDDINSDYIISSRRKRDTIDERVLRQFVFEAIDPAFAASVQRDDIVVAGRNFGCGSAMETAVTVIGASGIGAVLAQSFARSFYRNAINNGLLAIECDTTNFVEGDALRVELLPDSAQVRNLTQHSQFPGAPMPVVMQRILAHGGLVGYLRAGGEFAALPSPPLPSAGNEA